MAKDISPRIDANIGDARLTWFHHYGRN